MLEEELFWLAICKEKKKKLHEDIYEDERGNKQEQKLGFNKK